MPISPSTGEFISLDDAKNYVTEYRNLYPEENKCFSFGSDKLIQILKQENCIGLRIYNGYSKDNSQPNLVVVGVDKDQKDMTNGLILQKSSPWSDANDPGSPLN